MSQGAYDQMAEQMMLKQRQGEKDVDIAKLEERYEVMFEHHA